MPRTVVIQQIHVIWSKRSRGAPGAARRNALPKALPLIPSNAAYVYQRHSLREAGDGFQHALTEERTDDEVPRTVGDLSVQIRGEQILVGIHWNPYSGAPPRRNEPKALILEAGEYGRITTNGRHAGYSGQWYSGDTYNVALVDAVRETMFTERAPDREFSFEADLF